MSQHTFLYVEDDALSREIMQMIMQMAMGIEHPVIFADSTSFMARVEALSPTPDIFLLDIHVAPHDGFAMLKMLRADSRFATARIVALTASVMNEEVDELRQAGFDGAIAKPLSVQTFPGLLERIIAGEAIWHITE